MNLRPPGPQAGAMLDKRPHQEAQACGDQHVCRYGPQLAASQRYWPGRDQMLATMLAIEASI